jgi:hypothetical protein
MVTIEGMSIGSSSKLKYLVFSVNQQTVFTIASIIQIIIFVSRSLHDTG